MFPRENTALFSGGFHSRIAHNQVLSASGETTGHLNISSAQVEDGGEYTCLARNQAGEVAHSSRLNIYGEIGYITSSFFYLALISNKKKLEKLKAFRTSAPCPKLRPWLKPTFQSNVQPPDTPLWKSSGPEVRIAIELQPN